MKQKVEWGMEQGMEREWNRIRKGSGTGNGTRIAMEGGTGNGIRYGMGNETLNGKEGRTEREMKLGMERACS